MQAKHLRAARLAITGALLAASLAAVAAPAPWYQWRSKIDDFTVCKQFSPGDGWYVARGPFQDGNCKKPGTVK